jgi:hypothetical protein
MTPALEKRMDEIRKCHNVAGLYVIAVDDSGTVALTLLMGDEDGDTQVLMIDVSGSTPESKPTLKLISGRAD